MTIIVNSRDLISRKVFWLTTLVTQYINSHWGFLLRWGMIVGVLLLAPMIGILSVKINPIFVIAGLVAPVGLVAAQYGMQRSNWGPLVIIIAAAFIPFELPTTSESVLVDSLLLTMMYVGNWILTMLLVEKRLHIRPSPINIPLLGFVFITLFSVVWSIVMRDPLVYARSTFPLVQIVSAIVMVLLPGGTLFIYNHLDDIKILRYMVIAMMVASALALMNWFVVDTIEINDSGLFTMWAISLGVAMILFNREISWKWKSLLLVMASGWIYLRFGEQIGWLAGWLPPFVALGVLFFMRSKRLLLIVIIAVVLIVATNAEYYLGSVIEAESEESGHTRMAAWEVNWRVTGKHLVFGTGPAGYAIYYMSYFPRDGMATHSNYIDVIAQTGIFGLIFIVWLLFALAWMGYKLCLRLKGRGDFVEGLANAALAGTVGCIVAMGFGDWLLPFAYTQTIIGFDHAIYSWLFMGSILVLDRLIPPKPDIGTTA